MTNAKHTPGPWQGYMENKTAYIESKADQKIIASCGITTSPESKANAAFIVRACNSHDALVEALEALEARALEMRKLINPKTWSDLESMATVEIINARAALALAKGE